MLPLWRNRLTVILRPTQVIIIERQRNWKQYARPPVVHTLDGSTADTEWGAPLAALRDWLTHNKPARARAKVIVSDCYARYALIPWPRDIVKNVEIKIYARLYFNRVLGHADAEKDWHVNVDWSRYGQPGIGCMLPAEMTRAIRDVFAACGLRVASLSGNFIAAHNLWRSEFATGEILFVVVDSEQCTFASFRNGRWLNLRSQRMAQVTEASLTALIKRELLRQGLAAQALIYVHMYQHGLVWHFDSLGARLRLLQGPFGMSGSPLSDGGG